MDLSDYVSQAMGQILAGLTAFDPQGNHLVPGSLPERVEFDVAVVPVGSALSVATGPDPTNGIAAPGLSRVRFTVPLRPARPDFAKVPRPLAGAVPGAAGRPASNPPATRPRT